MASHSYIFLCLCAASQFTILQSHRISGITQGGIQLAASDLLEGEGALQAAGDLVGATGTARDLLKNVVYDIKDAMLNQVGNGCHDLDAICNFLDRMEKDPAKPALIAVRLYTIFTGIRTNWNEPAPKWANEIRDTISLSGWGVFDEIADPKYLESTEYANAKVEWTATWEQWHTNALVARPAYEGGDTTAWLKTLSDVQAGIVKSLKAGSPNNNEIWDLVDKSLGNLINAWSNYAEGNIALAVGQVWTALFSLAEPVFGLDPTSPTGVALGQVDIVLNTATVELQAFEDRKKLPKGDANEFKICYTRTYTRRSQPVSQCYYGFSYDQGSGHCIAQSEHGADCEQACEGNLGKACPRFCPVDKRYCCKKGVAGSPFECSEARYVDLKFAVGEAQDYYQCVSPALNVFNAVLQEIEAGSLLEEEESASAALLERAKVGGQVRTRASLDRSASGKGESGPPAVTNGNAVAVCDPNSIYTEILPKYPGQCYEKCPPNYEAEMKDDVEDVNCMQSCSDADDGLIEAGNFGIGFGEGETPLNFPVCSTTGGVLKAENDNSLGVATAGTTELINVINKIRESAVLTDAEITQFVQEVAKVVVHFAKPSCGEEVTPPS